MMGAIDDTSVYEYMAVLQDPMDRATGTLVQSQAGVGLRYTRAAKRWPLADIVSRPLGALVI